QDPASPELLPVNDTGGTHRLPARLVRRRPDGGPGRELILGLGQGQQAPLYAQFEYDVLVEAWPDLAVAFGQDPAADHLPQRRVGDLAGPAGQGEAVVLARRRASLAVQRVAPVPAQVLLFGPGHDEQVQARVADDRADRVHPRGTVGPDRGQEGQSDAELVELPAPGVGQGGLLPVEVGPGDHLADPTPLSLTSCVSDSGVAWRSCAPTGCSRWPYCSRRGVRRPRGRSPPNSGSASGRSTGTWRRSARRASRSSPRRDRAAAAGCWTATGSRSAACGRMRPRRCSS